MLIWIVDGLRVQMNPTQRSIYGVNATMPESE